MDYRRLLSCPVTQNWKAKPTEDSSQTTIIFSHPMLDRIAPFTLHLVEANATYLPRVMPPVSLVSAKDSSSDRIVQIWNCRKSRNLVEPETYERPWEISYNRDTAILARSS